ncbi:hypothetical protein AKJ37_06975 [candidate division MSBL1 archaeon SCGC-AAA259I09]|uniref:Uncharacterized protein n=1 Tax=candidate division MSBL1 archaeon SCGC-AAA259I09 TaxID=1698267 RepID=A0A133ULZ9_9EURY|nr:hypothetical protein AKJ37_06975 [candidate division MSBL1 archaeon SCGC-AAA259I09]
MSPADNSPLNFSVNPQSDSSSGFIFSAVLEPPMKSDQLGNCFKVYTFYKEPSRGDPISGKPRVREN